MSVTPVSQIARQAIQDRLADPTIGYNPLVARRHSQLGLPIPTTIDFSKTSQQFFLAQINPDQKEQSGIFKYPMIALYATKSQNTNDQKFGKFSGTVDVTIDFWLSWVKMDGLQNHEDYCDAVEDTVMEIINRPETQQFKQPLVYNGDISCVRYPLTLEGSNWRQRLSFSVTFGLFTM